MRRRAAGTGGGTGAWAAASGRGGFYARTAHCRRYAPGRMKRGIKAAAADRHGPASAPRLHSEGLAARRIALQILLRVERDGAFADVLIGGRLHGFAAADRRLITQLVLGTIAWQGRLDFEL